MMRQISLVLAGILGAIPAAADIKILATYNNGGQSSETTIYANGTRLRYEYGKGLVLVRQCDVNRIVQVDDKAKTYVILPAQQEVTAGGQEGQSSSAKTEVTDTNERKDMFGYPARHLKLTEIAEGKHERTETDGWYIDLKDIASCSHEQGGSGAGGYPVAYATTTYGENGKPASTMNMRVTSLITGPLETSLFEIPRGYSESNPQAELQKVTQKAPGSTRIGMVALENQSSLKLPSKAAENQLVSQLAAAQLEVVPLADGIPEVVQQKAREMECDYVLYNQLTALEKPASGKVGSFLHKTPAIGHMAGGDAMEAHLTYRLVPADGGSALLTSSITGKTGSSFDWKSAALLASNVLPMTMGLRMLGGAFNPAMMTSLMGGRGSGGAIMSMDPMMSSLSMFLRATNGVNGAPGGQAQNAPGADAALAAAFDQEAKAIIGQLKGAAK